MNPEGIIEYVHVFGPEVETHTAENAKEKCLLYALRGCKILYEKLRLTLKASLCASFEQ